MSGSIGYLALIRRNPHFRRLWLGNVISLLGDWFNTIALYSLIIELSASEMALGAVLIAKMLPWAIVSPLAGVLVDRFDRRRLMMVANVLRAIVVLGLVVVNEPDEVYLVYVLTTLQVVIGAVFQPAQTASIPNVAKPEELLTANALMAATWSVMLSVGAVAGGFVTEWVGIQAVFVLDSLTYVVSTWFIYRTVIPQTTEAPMGSLWATAWGEVVAGVRYLRHHPPIQRITFAKATWATAGGGLVYMLVLLGDELALEALAVGIGVMFMARGIGTGIGPILARAVFRNPVRWPSVLGWCIVFSGVCYGLVSVAPWATAAALPLLIGLVVLAHASSGANWVLSTVMLQQRTEDRYRGRIFALEWLFVMLADSVAILVASALLAAEVFDLRLGIRYFAIAQFACGLAWVFFVAPRENALRAVTPST